MKREDERILNIVVSFAGLLGFSCINYFENQEPIYLWSIGMLSAFSLLIHAKIISRKDFSEKDIQYIENKGKAKIYTFNVMRYVICISWIGIAALIGLRWLSAEILIIVVSAMYILGTYIYMCKLYLLECSRK